ncbi:hypothetical protein N5853_09110 [Bartonella sp. HY329]|uniref:hypothetical protein n=1 Tax=unclassified Bartonella TaxID=2645622 RepID=UPI0021C8C18F|nr:MULTISPECIES: hypothetical protein [unclassified Bartonella]UXM94265.1 hypothetical protein N5853_09110 [Bartonella sp. HY329]UXN08588.1 hypothetical protein N5852_09120 [Bartonella sp. HY328]
MTSEEFIDAMKKYIETDSIEIVKENLQSPPGRYPSQKDVMMSQFYNSLSEEDRSKINTIIKEAVQTTFFEIFCVIDGVKFIEDSPEKGIFKLIFEKNGKQYLLNSSDDEFLHDLYNTEPD